MKSSTIRRSTLSRESMEVIENLAREQGNDDSFGEYIRPEEEVSSAKESDFASKAQEIDLLWQNFKTTQFSSNSPSAYILIGFIAGVLTTAVFAFGLNAYMSKYSSAKLFVGTPVGEQTIEQNSELIQEETDNKVSVPTDEETQIQDDTKSAEQTVENNSGNESAQPAVDTSKMKKYKIKSGDTGESIIKHFYGTYTPERAEQIIKVNNLKNLDRINIDQELLIPMP